MHKNWFKYTQWSPVESGGVRWSPVESGGVRWSPVDYPVDVVKGTDIYI